MKESLFSTFRLSLLARLKGPKLVHSSSSATQSAGRDREADLRGRRVNGSRVEDLRGRSCAEPFIGRSHHRVGHRVARRCDLATTNNSHHRSARAGSLFRGSTTTSGGGISGMPRTFPTESITVFSPLMK